MDIVLRKLFPRNLTAWANHRIVGNPVVTRPEDAVANCYPGLELDVRNLDRRFFPGLVFEFIARADTGNPYTQPRRYGAWLSYVDLYGDPDVQGTSPAAQALYDQLSTADFTGDWYLSWVEQAGKRLTMSWHRPDPTAEDPDRRQADLTPLDGLYVWRIVRSLESGPVTIGLARRDDPGTPEVVLHGWRRNYTDEVTGVLSAAYQPGELLQSLCSPWTHDFRDCACHYWASNHPDVVLGAVHPGEPTLPDGRSTDPTRGTMLLDWLRSERRRDLAGGAENTIPKNRPYQFDHYQINQAWDRLAVVLQDQEIDAVYTPRVVDDAVPYASPEELARIVREKLAPLELVLALEYLYSCFSLKDADEADPAWPTMSDDVTFVRHYVLLTAQNEMMHLRWANEILWELYEAGLIASYDGPVLTPALLVPTRPSPQFPDGFRPRRLEPATAAIIGDFTYIEDPGGYIDSTYSRVVATLRKPEYPPHLADLAGRISADGIAHFSRFKDISHVLRTYRAADPPDPYLRELRVGTPDETRAALALFETIVANLTEGYADAAKGRPVESGSPLAHARQTMLDLYQAGESLARQGIGIPFFVEVP
jgi:hypothetical protein